MSELPHFTDLLPTEPEHDAVRAAYDAVIQLAGDEGVSATEVVAAWEQAARPARQWQSWTQLRFYQDTQDPERKAARQRADLLHSLLTELDDALLAALLGREDLAELEAVVGSAVIGRWRADRAAFDPAIAADMLTEQDLSAEYSALNANAKLQFNGQEHTLVTIHKEALSLDRSTRHAAEAARWGWFDDNTEQLDRIFDDLVQLRTKMARTLGMPDFTGLGYLKMHRIDYDREDVKRFRAEVRDRLVPLSAALMKEQQERLGVERMHLWDEEFGDPTGPPPLLCGMDGLGDAGLEAFDQLDPAIGAFYRQLHGQQYMDLGTRPGKAGGGFCTWFDDVRSPFVFCSGNGTSGDARTLVHEVGHAFQTWSSRESPVSAAVFPTYESAEIHSMGLEHLAWPVLDVFFGDRVDDFKRDHLVRGLRFIPYGVAVDHFQHLVYERPDASPADRHAMWQEMERTYMPWRSYGDLPHVSRGGYWQRQRHIYNRPFYYIDYTLALTCALQLWAASLDDHPGTMERYHALCGRGGSLAFQDLCASAGLVSPFEPGCLDDVVARAESWLAQH